MQENVCRACACAKLIQRWQGGLNKGSEVVLSVVPDSGTAQAVHKRRKNGRAKYERSSPLTVFKDAKGGTSD